MATTDKRLKECTSVILECSREQLTKVRQVLEFRKEQIAKELKNDLKIGDIVLVYSSKGTEKGVITGIKRTNAVVKINGKLWNCPLTLLDLDDENN